MSTSRSNLPKTALELENLLSFIKQLRLNLYPEDWDADPLYHIEESLEALIDNL